MQLINDTNSDPMLDK